MPNLPSTEELLEILEEQDRKLKDLQNEVQKKDFLLSEALNQAEEWKRQAQNQTDQSRQIRELRSQISELSSINSTLMSELRKKSEMIVSLNEKEEIYNRSDLIRQENENLKRENSSLQKNVQNALQKAAATITAVKEEYAGRKAELDRRIASAEYRERQADTLQANLSRQADARAERLAADRLEALQGEYKAKGRSLDSEYKALTAVHECLFFGSLLYGILVTLFTAIRSKAFVSDFKAFFLTAGQFIVWIAKSLVSLAEWASQLGDMIPQPIAAFIVHWILWIVACFGSVIGIAALLLIGFSKWFDWFGENQADLAALSVLLVSLALVIFFAESIKGFLPVNLILLLFLVQIATMGIRAYIQACKRSRGYC